jgi:hypothetical protein
LVSFSNFVGDYLRGHAARHRTKTSNGYEEAHAYRCTRLVSLGRIGRLTRCCATRYVERPVTIGGSRRAVSAHASPESKSNDRRFLHRGNDGDVLQRRHRAQHERLWNEERLRIEQRLRIERRREHVVDSPLSGATAIQRIVQLSKTKPRPNITAQYH